jgi:hypothetical protein
MAFEFGEVSYRLREILLASFDQVPDTYGAPISLDGDQMMEVDPQADTDMLRDSGRNRRALAVVTHGDINLQAGGFDWGSIAILTGATAETCGSTPSRVREVLYPELLPYFGAIGVADTDDDGVFVVGLRMCKLNKRFKYTFDGTQNRFMVNDDLGGVALFYDDGTNDIMDKVRVYETAADWDTAKPSDGAEFRSFFDSVP